MDGTLDARGTANRTLVSSPSIALVSKWQMEMDERFGFEDFAGSDENSLTRMLDLIERDRLPLRFHARWRASRR